MILARVYDCQNLRIGACCECRDARCSQRLTRLYAPSVANKKSVIIALYRRCRRRTRNLSYERPERRLRPSTMSARARDWRSLARAQERATANVCALRQHFTFLCALLDGGAPVRRLPHIFVVTSKRSKTKSAGRSVPRTFQARVVLSRRARIFCARWRICNERRCARAFSLLSALIFLLFCTFFACGRRANDDEKLCS